MTDPRPPVLRRNPLLRQRERELRVLAGELMPAHEVSTALKTIQGWDGYMSRPPTALPALAGALGLAALHYQDEGARFEIQSFKPWGGAYAAVRVLDRVPGATLACATDGNHGRAIAWVAAAREANAVVYMADVASEQVEAEVRALGARVVRCEGNHEIASAACLADARANGWYVITETENATEPEIATDTLAGYGALWSESLDGLDRTPTHLFIQAGVGGLAAAAAAATARRFGEARPILVLVEAESADCIGRSLEAGRRVAVEGRFDTRLAGLAAGATSRYAWSILRAAADFAVAIEDGWAHAAMRRLADPIPDDPAVEAGGSGAAGLGGLLAATAVAAPGERPAEPMQRQLGLGPEARVLAIGTEGVTDADSFERIVGRRPSAWTLDA